MPSRAAGRCGIHGKRLTNTPALSPAPISRVPVNPAHQAPSLVSAPITPPAGKQPATDPCAIRVHTRNASGPVIGPSLQLPGFGEFNQCSATRCPLRFTSVGELEFLPRDLIGRNIYELCF